MATNVRQNERSSAIEIISYINTFLQSKDMVIKHAGGENTVSVGANDRMFPDVILYGDRDNSFILQGWELKMPDVSIDDFVFVSNARAKAEALGLDSFLLWNFTHVVLYRKESDLEFKKYHEWNDTDYIRTREDVAAHRVDWEKLLEKVIMDLNEFFLRKELRASSIGMGEFISNTVIATIIEKHNKPVAEELKKFGRSDAVLSSHIDEWWRQFSLEYGDNRNAKDPSYIAYAKSVLLNWANRIVFAHVIKRQQNEAMRIDDVDEGTEPGDVNSMFRDITEKSDFYNIFREMEYDEILPDSTWRDLVSFSSFLKDSPIEKVDQSILQSIMENSVAETKRYINGQYATPQELAKLLVSFTVSDYDDAFLDCCCGTGTIPRAAIELKKRHDVTNPAESVWASDKNQYLLQVANLSLATPDTINVVNRIFRHNALDLRCGEEIEFIDPTEGGRVKYPLPEFGAIASNLPFVQSREIVPDDRDLIESLGLEGLDNRSDLYCYIALKIADLLKEHGRLGIITSNAWLATITGRRYVDALKEKYYIDQVHISGCGRWFTGPDIVTTLMVLEKKGAAETESEERKTGFYLWKKNLDELASDDTAESDLINSAMLKKKPDHSVADTWFYTSGQIDGITKLNLSYNVFFHNVGWLTDFLNEVGENSLVQINEVYDVIRGSRRGWDKMFYPRNGGHRIEQEFLTDVLKNTKNLKTFVAEPDGKAFCCSKSENELVEGGYDGTVEWIERFKTQRNGRGIPLPEVLARTDMEWYELNPAEKADVCTIINPYGRLFFAEFKKPTFINQTFVGMRRKDAWSDTDLNLALLNSVVTLFFLEGRGYGRGLGALSLNSEVVADCRMPNPKKISAECREKILAKFAVLKNRVVKELREELISEDRISFEKEVFAALNAEGYFEKVRGTLLSMAEVRLGARR